MAVTVTCVNDDPDAVDDTATVVEDSGPNTIDVLANDTDADGDSVTITAVTQPANGTVVITNAGADLTYEPNENYCNDGSPTDDFTYTIDDGNGGTDTANVEVSVTCVNDDPDAVDDIVTVVEDSVLNTIDVLANDTDADGDTLTITAVTQPANGSVINNGTDVSYSPNVNYCNDGDPTDDFTYTIDDGNGGTDTANVAVTVTCVNDDPDAVDDTATVVEDSGPNTIDVLANDTDADGDSVTITAVTQPANGTVVITNAGADLTYEPNENYCNDGSPTDDFTYTIDDGNGGTDTANVEVSVTCVNDAPVVTVTGDQNVDEGDTEIYTFSTVDVDSSSFSVVGDPDCGVSGDYVDDSLVFDPDTGGGTFECSFPDDDPTGDPANDTTVSITINDGTDSDTGSLPVTVNNVAPSVSLTGPSSVAESHTLRNYVFDTTDPGVNDTFTAGTPTAAAASSSARSSSTRPPATATSTAASPTTTQPARRPTRPRSASPSLMTTPAPEPAARPSPSTTSRRASRSPAPSPVAESQTLRNYVFDTTDPGTLDTFTAGTPDCGSGVFVGPIVFNAATGDGSFNCRFADDNPTGTPSDVTSVSITITDDDTGAGTGSQAVTVNNVAPSVTVTGPSPVNESQTLRTYLFDTTDPGLNDTFSAGTPDCGTGVFVGPIVFSSTTGDGSFDCRFADDNPTGTPSDVTSVSITITDDDTGAGTGSQAVTVNNVAPSVISHRPEPGRRKRRRSAPTCSTLRIRA